MRIQTFHSISYEICVERIIQIDQRKNNKTKFPEKSNFLISMDTFIFVFFHHAIENSR